MGQTAMCNVKGSLVVPGSYHLTLQFPFESFTIFHLIVLLLWRATLTSLCALIYRFQPEQEALFRETALINPLQGNKWQTDKVSN